MRVCTKHIASLFLLVALVIPVFAFDLGDHDRARQALEAGEILPLEKIIDEVNRNYSGHVMEVILEHEDDRWVYEIKQLRSGGLLVKIHVDASNGTVIVRRGHEMPGR